ncbi:MAG: rhodanese-like domain-containing protein [Acidobacteriaceae bacterium]|nr:rhodanese-like domain-containing protein [Acidobacteriaceae bacterium]
MTFILAGSIVILVVSGLWIKRRRDRRLLDQHSITPEGLHALLNSRHDVLVFDVRLPLDLLADSEIIPGATRLDPEEVIENPSLIPKDSDAVVYCTCPSDKTARRILHRALGLKFFRVKFLRGGLAAWKAKGYPVEPYKQSFRLDTLA